MIKREDRGWRNFHLQWWLCILHAQIINTYESQGSPENRTNRICIWKVKVLVTQSFPTLFDPRDWSLPGSSVHGILQARILEWVAIPFSRGSSLPRDWTQVSCNAGRLFTVWTTRENFDYWELHLKHVLLWAFSHLKHSCEYLPALCQFKRSVNILLCCFSILSFQNCNDPA